MSREYNHHDFGWVTIPDNVHKMAWIRKENYDHYLPDYKDTDEELDRMIWASMEREYSETERGATEADE